MCKALMMKIDLKSSTERPSLCSVGNICEAAAYPKLNSFEARYPKIIIGRIARDEYKNVSIALVTSDSSA